MGYLGGVIDYKIVRFFFHGQRRALQLVNHKSDLNLKEKIFYCKK